jgi:AcrR family transcriptional regulator
MKSATTAAPASARAYRMRARARSAEATRERVLRAAYGLWLEKPYDEVSLQRVAEAAGVSKQTVLRLFASKDQLAFAVVDWQRPREEAARDAPPGDAPEAVARLLERYEAMGDANVRALELEARVPAIAYLLAQSRESHRRWVERAFAPFLPARRGAAHRRRVMAFYAATEVTVWKLLRRDFALSRAEAQGVILHLVEALAAQAQAAPA